MSLRTEDAEMRKSTSGKDSVLLAFFATSLFSEGPAAPRQKYTWLGSRSCTKNLLRYFAHPSHNFDSGSKSAKFVFDF